MHATIQPTTAPAPLTDRTTALTPEGHAAVALYRFLDSLIELSTEDRAVLVDLAVRDLTTVGVA